MRLTALDAFRGLTIALMIVVNSPGDGKNVFWPLEHAEWHGWTPTDLVFPFFVFIVGVSVVLAGTTKGGVSTILRRTALIFVLGLLLNQIWVPKVDFATWRIPGVLQRIAICYLVCALLVRRIVRRRRLGPRRFAWEWRLAPWPGHVATVLEKPSVRRRARDARRRGREGIAPRYSSRIQAAVGGARGPQSAASRVRMLTGSVTAARTMSLPPQRTQTRRSCSKVRLRSVRQLSRELEA